MRISLILILLVFLGIFGLGLEEYFSDMKDAPAYSAEDYFQSKPGDRHFQLNEAYLDFTGVFWSETKYQTVSEVYIPVVASLDDEDAAMYLCSQDAADIALVKEISALDEASSLAYFLKNRDKMIRKTTLDLKVVAAPKLDDFSVPAAVYVRNASGKKEGFPVISLSLVLASGMFAFTSFRLPRVQIQSGTDTVTLAGLAQHELDQLPSILEEGGRIVVYQYCISILVLTFKRPSEFYLLRPGENALAKGMHCTFVSLILGWWGIPWGPIYTIGSLIKNLGGGADITEAFRSVPPPPPAPPSPDAAPAV